MTTHPPETACPIDEAFDPLSPEFLADPYPVMAALPPAAERTVFFASPIGYYVVTRQADIEQVFREPSI
jgi:cytochrome P450